MDAPPPRRRRTWTALALLAATLTAAVLAVQVWGWFLLVAPFTLVWAYGAWLGLREDELLDALGPADADDPGRGPAGIWP